MTKLAQWGPDPRAGGGPSVGAPSGSPRGSKRGPAVYAPPAAESAGTGATPGTFNISLVDPAGSMTQNLQEAEQGIAGLKNTLFGTSAPDREGKHGGLGGDIPVLGAGLRFLSESVANVGSTIGTGLKGALDITGGALEHINLNTPETNRELQAKFDALPDSPEKRDALEAIKRDPGATGHYMAKVARTFEEEQLAAGKVLPDFTTGLWRTPGSAAEAFDNLLGIVMISGRAGERTWTGVSTPGQGGMDRLGLIKRVGDGGAVFNEDKGLFGTGLLAGDPTTGLNAIEAIAYKMTKSGEWTDDQARDFLVAHNAGTSHAAIANIGGAVAFDPANFAALGASLVTRFGKVGQRLVSAVGTAEKALAKTDDLIGLADAAGDTVRLAELAATRLDDVKSLEQAAKGAYKLDGDVSKLNPLGLMARSETMTNIARGLYKTYEPLQAIHVDKALKTARAIVDPLGAFSLRNPFRKQMVELMSSHGTRVTIGAYGDGNHVALVHALSDLTPGQAAPLADMFSEAMGTYSGNLIRRVIARAEREVAITSRRAQAFMEKSVEDVLEEVGTVRRRSFDEHVLREANAHRIMEWDDVARQNLADRLADNFGIQEADEWMAWLSGRNADQLSMLHASTYGHATGRLLSAVEAAAHSLGSMPLIGSKLQRLVLINRTTLTDVGANGVLERMKKALTTEDKLAEIDSAKLLYPELRGAPLDETDIVRAIDRWAESLSHRVDSLPHQVMDNELAELPSDLRALHSDKTYTLGFAPEDEYKWGMARSNEAGGAYAAVADVFVDHVASGSAMGYRPVSRLVEQNIAGQPVIGAVGTKLARGIDYIDAGVQTLGRRISGTLIAETARASFIAKASTRYAKVGITKEVASAMMARLDAAVNNQDIVVRPSGFTTRNMWAVAAEAIPTHIRRADFGPRDLMNLVLEAYDGDMRYVGLTQKLSSRVKRVLAFDNNNASVLAESVYPTLKYRLNSIFQLQEKLEPFILNTARGVTPAKSVKTMNEADKATSVLLERMANRSLVTNADYDMAEDTARAVVGQSIEEVAADANSSLGRVTKKLGIDWASLRDVKGVKQVNMLRTFRKGLGKELRSAWEQGSPGLFDDMYNEAVRKAQRGVGGLSEDEFAVSILAEQMLGNGVTVTGPLNARLKGLANLFDKVDYKASIAPGKWMSPQTLGELSALDLDSMAEMLAFPMRNGGVVKTQADLRAGLASGELKMADVLRAVRAYNPDPDYVMRFQSALEFSWTGFWGQVKRDFNPSPEMLKKLEDYVGNAAAMRGMTPIDYLSQMLVPMIGNGDQGAVVGHLGKIIDILGPEGRVMGQRADLGQLMVPSAGAGTEAMLVNQLATVFSAHLDPSAKRALLLAFRPVLEDHILHNLDLNMATVNRLWDDSMNNEFADYVLGEISLRDVNELDLWEAARLTTIDEYDAIDPGTVFRIEASDGRILGEQLTSFIGDGLRASDPATVRTVLSAVGDMRAQLPGLKLRHVNIVEESAMSRYMSMGETGAGVAGVTVFSPEGGLVVLLNRTYFGGPNTDEAWKRIGRGEENFRTWDGRPDPRFNETSRESFIGAPRNVGGARGQAATVQHEIAHVLDETILRRANALRKAKKTKGAEYRGIQQYLNFRRRYIRSTANRSTSEYAMAADHEAMAELVAVALGADDAAALDASTRVAREAYFSGSGPQVRPPRVAISKIEDMDSLRAWERWTEARYGQHGQEELLDVEQELLGAVYPDDQAELLDMIRADARIWEKRMRDSENAARSLDEDVAAGADFIRPEGLPSAYSKDVGRGYQSVQTASDDLKDLLEKLGYYKPKPHDELRAGTRRRLGGARSQNPDVIRAGQQFNLWTQKVLGESMQHGGNASQAALLQKITGLPTDQAVPYNFTEHKLLSSATESMREKWDDAHRLQYYARERTMLERSINHPMFGIYPASYMWGKMLPEIIRFVTKEPFGARTGAAAMSMMDVQRAVALQREFDPAFDEKIEKLGHSAAFWALGYMMPSWPWEASAAMPAWQRNLAQQGLDMQARAESGGTVGTDAADTGIDLMQSAGKAFDVMSPLKAFGRAFADPLEEVTDPGAEEEVSQVYNPTGPIRASELGDPLTNALDSLRGWLGG